MKITIRLLGVFIILAGGLLLVNPDRIYDWAEGSLNKTSLYVAAIVGRLILGLILVLAAKESKYPGAIKFFGYLAITAAIVFLLIGQQNFQNFLASIMASLKAYSLLSGIASIVMGGLLIYAFLGEQEGSQTET